MTNEEMIRAAIAEVTTDADIIKRLGPWFSVRDIHFAVIGMFDRHIPMDEIRQELFLDNTLEIQFRKAMPEE